MSHMVGRFALERIGLGVGLQLLLLQTVVGQVAQAPKQAVPTAYRVQQKIPIAHYYWHFLIHQNDVDRLATLRTAKGLDGTWMRNHLQMGVGFSDVDYGPVRISASRLGAELNALDTQAKTIRAGVSSIQAAGQLHSLAIQQEADISAEVTYLQSTLSPAKITIFEAYMVSFFSPVKVSVTGTVTSAQATLPTVQP